MNGHFGVLEEAAGDHLESSGTLQLVNGSGPLKGQVVNCTYSQSSTEPPSPGEPSDLFGLIELATNPEQPGMFTAKFHYPLSPGYVNVAPAGSEDEQCEFFHSVATQGEPSHESGYDVAINPFDHVEVDFDSAAAEQIYKIPHSYAGSFDGDEVDLADEEVVKIDRLPDLPPPFPTGGPPPSKIEPTTPIPGADAVERTATHRRTRSRREAPVLGGGDPPKLHTGITAKCPKAIKACTVTGVITAELPVARHASAARSARAKARRVVLGRVSFVLAGGASRKVIVALPRSAVAFLRSHPGVRARIAVTVAAPGATKVSRSRTARSGFPGAGADRLREPTGYTASQRLESLADPKERQVECPATRPHTTTTGW